MPLLKQQINGVLKKNITVLHVMIYMEQAVTSKVLMMKSGHTTKESI